MRIVKVLQSISTGSAVTIFQREDDTFGYFVSSELVEDEIAAELAYRCTSRFDAVETAEREVSSRVDWLVRELTWPARDRSATEATLHAEGFVRCPFCRIVFSVHDVERWNGERHLTCGQRISAIAEQPCG